MTEGTLAMFLMIGMGVAMMAFGWATHTDRIAHAEFLSGTDNGFKLWPMGVVFIGLGALVLSGLDTAAGLWMLTAGPVGMWAMVFEPRWVQPEWRRLQQAEEDHRRTERKATRRAAKADRRKRR